MRINEDLEKKLLVLEESGKDNLLSLLEVAEALEKVYTFINESMLDDEKEFDIMYNDFEYVKERYDAINGKTIYNVKSLSGELLFDIEVSNMGEISFTVLGESKDEITKLIDKINEPSNEVLELIKLNADISFFTENREFVLSAKPYIALKMGNFVEGPKAVIVYKEEAKQNEINKTNTGLKYLRIDQIEGYLKNIKIDERKVPVLAYAYLGKDFSQGLIYRKNELERSTFPQLTEDKIEEYTNHKYENDIWNAGLSVSLAGGFCLGIVGALVGGLSILPFWPCLLVGAGVPIVTGVGIINHGTKNIRRSEQKEELVRNAKLKTYSILKECANENISYKEAEFTRLRAKKNRRLIGKSVDGKLNNTEVIKNIRSAIDDVEYYDRPFLNILFMHALDNYSESEEKQKETELYDRLFDINNIIENISDIKYVDLIGLTLNTIVKSNADYNISLSALNELITATADLANQRSSVQAARRKIMTDITKAEVEIMLRTVDEGKNLSVETIASLSEYNKGMIDDMLINFGERIGYFSEEDKKSAALDIAIIKEKEEPTEVKIIKMINVVSSKNLIPDLLGKEIKKSEKVKELK